MSRAERSGLPCLSIVLVLLTCLRAWAGDPSAEQEPPEPSVWSLLGSCCCAAAILIFAGAAGFAIFNRVSGRLVQAGLSPGQGPQIR